MTDSRNTILAVILSGLVLIAWQYFYNIPQMERQRAQSQTQAELTKPSTTPTATPTSTHEGGGAPQQSPSTPAAASNAPLVSRDAAIEATPRVMIETPSVIASLSL
jgi:YidC/Oxa1 family membrane protein insertase